MKILFTSAPLYGLMLPIIPLAWAARAAGHEVLVATTSEMTEVGARAGLSMVDVLPGRDVGEDLMKEIEPNTEAETELDKLVRESAGPFGRFTLTMTEGTIAAGRAFGADLVVHTSDHHTGALTAAALDVPLLEVGNRISWSTRDKEWRETPWIDQLNTIAELVRAKLSIPDRRPRVIARIDPRAPSMGGIAEDETDPRDGVPWWPMQFVPYNGGAVAPPWLAERPERPRVCVTLGTVVPQMSGTTSLTAVIEALGGMDVDVVLAAGKADLSALGTLPENVRPAGFLPLSMILPSCSLIVHHGGSGSTAAPLFYGVPQLVLPSFADNFLSADRVAARGVGFQCDAATTDAATLRGLMERLLTEPAFAKAAAEVRDEMALQPSPSAVIERVAAALA